MLVPFRVFLSLSKYVLKRLRGDRKGRQYVILMLLLLCGFSACSADAGIFGGGNWQSTGLHQHIITLEVDPNNLQHLFAGNAQGTVFVSTDGALHWTSYAIAAQAGTTAMSMNKLAFDTSGKKLYAAISQGLFVSTDGAKQWTRVNTAASGLPQDGYTALAFDVNNANVLYTGTAQHGVFSSADNGVHWLAVSTGLPQGRAIESLAVDPDQHQLWAAVATGAYRSDDGGSSWRAFTTGFPVGVTINTVVPASVSGGTKGLIYAGTSKGFYLSKDSGAHWGTGTEALIGTSIRCILVDFRSSNPTTVYVCTDVGAFRSDDEGQNWRGIAAGLPRKVAVNAILLGAANYDQLYVGSDDVYVYPGTSGGLSPSRIPVLIGVLVFFFLLYIIARRGWREWRNLLKPTHIVEPPVHSEP